MNRFEFMQKLNALLSGISENERQEALKYYNDYFDDAGVENEASVINELESPEKVAATIKKDLGIEEEPVVNGYEGNASFTGGNDAPRKKTTAEIVLIVLLAIFAFPILIGFMGVIIGLICAAFGMVIGFGAAAIGLMIAGCCVFGLSIMKIMVIPAGGILLMGISFILFGLGFFFWLATQGIIKLVVAGVRLFVDFCKKLLNRRGGCTA